MDKETRKVDLNSETLGTTVALPSSPTHIGLNANEQTLAVCVKLNNAPHIYLYDTRAFLNPSGNDVKPFLEIPGSTPPGVSIKVQAFFLNQFMLWSFLYGIENNILMQSQNVGFQNIFK